MVVEALIPAGFSLVFQFQPLSFAGFAFSSSLSLSALSAYLVLLLVQLVETQKIIYYLLTEREVCASEISDRCF